MPVNLMRGEGRRPTYLSVNPGGKVPALQDGDLVLTESAAICNYLGDKYPASGLTPRCGSRERALYDRWCFFVLSELEQPLWTIGKHRFAIPERYRIPAVVDTAMWEFSVAAKALNAQFGGPFALGEQFTAADILIGHTLAWAAAWNVPLEHERLPAYALAGLWWGLSQPANPPPTLTTAVATLEQSHQLTRQAPAAALARLSKEIEALNRDFRNAVQILLASVP